MNNQALLYVLASSLTLFAAACGSGASGTGAGGALSSNPPANSSGPPTPATGSPSDHQSPLACNSNPVCGAANGGGSCTFNAQSCIDYTGSDANGRAHFQAACENNREPAQGHYSSAPCSSADLAGSCKIDGGNVRETIIRFYEEGGITPGIVEQACSTTIGNCAVYCSP